MTDFNENNQSKQRNQCKIIILPEIAELQKDIERLRTKLSTLLLERDELKYVQCKNIETAYMLALGSLVYKAYEAECAVCRLKRKIELIQAKRNRQERIVIKNIEKILDEEFAEYQKKLDEQINKMNEAIERKRGKFLSEEDMKEVKKLYRSIVKSLHPDLHPEATASQIRLLQNAVAAYESGDITSLRIISEMVSESVFPENNSSGIKELISEKDRLNENIRIINEAIASIKSDYPYALKSIIDNEDELAKKRKELEQNISYFNDQIVFYSENIEKMMR